MRRRIPFRDKRQQPFREMFFVRKIGNAQPFALQNREPLLSLVHPGTMHGRKVKHKAWMFAQPRLHLLALVHPQIVEHHVPTRDRRGTRALQMLQQCAACHVPFALGGGGIHVPGAGRKTGKEVQRSLARLRVLDP